MNEENHLAAPVTPKSVSEPTSATTGEKTDLVETDARRLWSWCEIHPGMFSIYNGRGEWEQLVPSRELASAVVARENEKLGKQEAGEDNVNAVLQKFRSLIVDPDDPLGEFERLGDMYYHDTGFLRPGKSEPMETGRDSNSRENVARFADWFDAKKREALRALEKLLSSNSNATGAAQVPETSAPSSSVAEKKEDLGEQGTAHTKHEPTTE